MWHLTAIQKYINNFYKEGALSEPAIVNTWALCTRNVPLIILTAELLAKYVPKEYNKSPEAISKSGLGSSQIVKGHD